MKNQATLLQTLGLPEDTVTAGGKLKSGEQTVHRAFAQRMPKNGKEHEEEEPEVDREKKSNLERLREACRTVYRSWGAWSTMARFNNSDSLPIIAANFARVAYERWKAPEDTQLYWGADDYLKRMSLHTAHGMFTLQTGLANEESAANLIKAHELNASGEQVTIEAFPHTSFLDPLMIQMILDRVRQTHAYSNDVREAANSMVDNTVIMVGQKLCLDRFGRIGSAGSNILGTITPWHRPLDKKLAGAYNGVSGTIADAIQKHRKAWMMIFPEAGRTKERSTSQKDHHIQVPWQIPRVMNEGEWRIPLWIKGPFGLLNIDKHDYKISMRPQEGSLFIGEPYQIQKPAGLTALETTANYLREYRRRMELIGAPMDDFRFGYTVEDKSKTIDEKTMRKTGQPVIFHPVV